MTAPAHPAPAAPIRVPAGTTAAAAVRDAGLPGRGALDAVVVVRDADGKLRDLSWVPAQDAEVTPVAANTDDGPQRHPAFDRACVGPSRARPVPARQAGDRAADHRWLLLRLRRGGSVHAGGLGEAGESGCARSSRTGSCSTGGSTSPRSRRAKSWPTSPTSSNSSTTSPATPTSWRSAATSSPLTTTSIPVPGNGSGVICAADRTSRPPSTSRRSS